MWSAQQYSGLIQDPSHFTQEDTVPLLPTEVFQRRQQEQAYQHEARRQEETQLQTSTGLQGDVRQHKGTEHTPTAGSQTSIPIQMQSQRMFRLLQDPQCFDKALQHSWKGDIGCNRQHRRKEKSLQVFFVSGDI